MTDEKKVQEIKANPEASVPQGDPQTGKQEQPPQVTIQQLIEAYPNDREKVRDNLLLGIVTELNRIATTLDWFAKRKQEEIDRNIQLRP